MELLIANLAERPDLLTRRRPGDDPWPEFMNQDLLAELYYADYREAFPEFVLVAIDPADPDRPVARAVSSAPTPSISTRGWPSTNTRTGPAPTASRRTPGCAFTSGPGAGLSGPPSAPW
jgi:hypothetical protein